MTWPWYGQGNDQIKLSDAMGIYEKCIAILAQNGSKTGMVKQMTSLASLGLLGNFIGMLTDSRSFLSYPRHEYFRRILCDLFDQMAR